MITTSGRSQLSRSDDLTYGCGTRTLLSADRGVIGVVWVVCDSLWNASSASWDRRQVLAESWAHHKQSPLMEYAPPVLATQVYDVRYQHWVLCLLLVCTLQFALSCVSCSIRCLTGRT